MHLVCLEVVKRLVRIWFDKGPKKCRLRSSDTQIVSDRLLNIRKSMPIEFCRKPRPVKLFKYWKATEFRSFLLYLGPVVLHGVLPKHLYEHFLLLHSAIYILACKKSENSDWRNYANDLIHVFVKNIPNLYCSEFLIYSFHNLLHLANDVENFGCLDQFSAFPFESFMNKIKRLIHAPTNPLKQVAKRLMEKNLFDDIAPEGEVKKICFKNGIIKSMFLQNLNCVVGTSLPDSCFLTNDDNIIIMKSIKNTTIQGTYKLHCYMFESKSDFYSCPLKSSDLGIYVVNKCKMSSKTISSRDLCSKCLILPNFQDDSSYVCLSYCNMKLSH